MKLNKFILDLQDSGKLEEILKNFAEIYSNNINAPLGMKIEKIKFSTGENGEIVAEAFEYCTSYTQTHIALETYTLTDFTCLCTVEDENFEPITKNLNQEWMDTVRSHLSSQQKEEYEKLHLKYVDEITAGAAKSAQESLKQKTQNTKKIKR